MAYGLRYQYEFQDYPPVVLGLTQWAFRVSFLIASYTGPVTIVQPGDKPLLIQTDGGNSNIFNPIVAQKYTFRLLCQSSWESTDFYVDTDRDMQVLIEYDKSNTGNAYQILRRGWVLPTDMKEDYNPKPYPVEISAACGLSTLRDRYLLDTTGTRLQGLVPVSQVIRTALLHTDLTPNLISGFNLYEITDVAYNQVVNGYAAVNRDPLYQTLMDAQALLTDDGNTMNCYDSLIKCLTTYQGAIAQLDGIWWAIRVPEMAGGWNPWGGNVPATVHTRKYTGNDLTASPDVAGDSSYNLGVTADYNGELRVKDGAEQMLRQRKAGVRVEQSFGKRLTGFINGEMTTVDATGLPTGWQTYRMPDRSRYRIGTGTDADPYRLVIEGAGDEKYNDGTPIVWTRAYYGTDSQQYKQFIARRLKGKFRLTNARAAKIIIIAIRDDGSYLRVDNDWVRGDKLTKAQRVAIRINNTHTELVNASKTYERQTTNIGIATYDIDLGTLDHVSEISISFSIPEALDKFDDNGKYQGADLGPPTPKCEYWPPYLEEVVQGLDINGTQQTIVRTGQTVNETTLSINLGDVPAAAQPINRTGTLYRRRALPDKVPTTLWFKPDANPGGLGNGVTSGQTLLSTITNNLARQLMYPAPTFDADLLGRLPFGPFSVLSVSDLSVLGRAILTSWEWAVQDCEHKVIAQRLAPETVAGVAGLPAVKKEWQTPEGPLLMNEADDGTPVAPVPKPFILPADELKKKLIELGYPRGFNPDLIPSGFTPGTSGKFGANLYNNNQLLASLTAQFRKQIKFKFPP